MSAQQDIKLRINGRAPAWPRLIGTHHPFYAGASSEELGSVSYSIFCEDWEVLIDAGHNTAQYLIQQGNRIPDAIVLTHAHPDHVLGVDYVAQSHYRVRNKKMPLYASQGAFEMFIASFPHVASIVDFRAFHPSKTIQIEEAENLLLTPFPVYHGKGAKGASMLFFRVDAGDSKPVLIANDMLCPLHRKEDVAILNEARLMFIDTNGQYAYPEGNHLSFTPFSPQEEERSSFLENWLKNLKSTDLIEPHIGESNFTTEYFKAWQKEFESSPEVLASVMDICRVWQVPKVGLVHYWGYYDKQLYNQHLLHEADLAQWANNEARKMAGCNAEFFIPRVGEIFHICA